MKVRLRRRLNLRLGTEPSLICTEPSSQPPQRAPKLLRLVIYDKSLPLISGLTLQPRCVISVVTGPTLIPPYII